MGPRAQWPKGPHAAGDKDDGSYNSLKSKNKKPEALCEGLCRKIAEGGHVRIFLGRVEGLSRPWGSWAFCPFCRADHLGSLQIQAPL